MSGRSGVKAKAKANARVETASVETASGTTTRVPRTATGARGRAKNAEARVRFLRDTYLPPQVTRPAPVHATVSNTRVRAMNARSSQGRKLQPLVTRPAHVHAAVGTGSTTRVHTVNARSSRKGKLQPLVTRPDRVNAAVGTTRVRAALTDAIARNAQHSQADGSAVDSVDGTIEWPRGYHYEYEIPEFINGVVTEFLSDLVKLTHLEFLKALKDSMVSRYDGIDSTYFVYLVRKNEFATDPEKKTPYRRIELRFVSVEDKTLCHITTSRWKWDNVWKKDFRLDADVIKFRKMGGWMWERYDQLLPAPNRCAHFNGSIIADIANGDFMAPGLKEENFHSELKRCALEAAFKANSYKKNTNTRAK